MRLNLDNPPINQKAILGITTIKDKLTFLVDLFSLAEQVAPDRFARRENEGRPEKDRLLVVDDPPFFRDLEKTYFFLTVIFLRQKIKLKILIKFIMLVLSLNILGKI